MDETMALKWTPHAAHWIPTLYKTILIPFYLHLLKIAIFNERSSGYSVQKYNFRIDPSPF